MSFELFQLIEQVLHNIAIAEYFKNACSNSKKLLEDLNTVKVNFYLGSLYSKRKKLFTLFMLIMSIRWFLLLFLFFLFQKQSEEFAKEPLEAVNPGSNVSVSKHQFDSTITTLNIVCSQQYSSCFFLSLSYAFHICQG